MICFEVFGVPVPKGSTKAFFNEGMKFPVVTADNTKTKPWASHVSYTAMKYRPQKPWAGPVSIHLTFQMPKPKGLPKTRPSWHLKKPDIDKLQRTILDSLKGIFYLDDAQVVHVGSTKIYGDSPSIIIRAGELSLDANRNLLEEVHLHAQPITN